MRKPVIGVMGGHLANQDVEAQAEALGQAIAEQGWILLNGGRDQGIMRASARGARKAGGLVVGVHPGDGTAGDVADVDIAIFTGIGYARNMVNILSSDVVVALPGGYGTLNEVAFASTYGKPLILFGFDDAGLARDAVRVEDQAACIEAIQAALTARSAPA